MTHAKSTQPNKAESQQVFQQFAWNLAGTLAKVDDKPRAKPKRRTTSVKRRVAGAK